MSQLMPRQPVPDLEVPTLDGGRWRLSEQSPAGLTAVLVYRGLHCPICSQQLKGLDGLIDQFAEKGVEFIAISADSEERARKAQEKWELKNLKIGYGLPIDKAREWGLYISSAIRDEEPVQFTEPGLFLIKPDRTLYGLAINSMPFARPHLEDLLGVLDFVIQREYPARGEAA